MGCSPHSDRHSILRVGAEVTGEAEQSWRNFLSEHTFLGTYYVPRSLLGAREIAINKTDIHASFS